MSDHFGRIMNHTFRRSELQTGQTGKPERKARLVHKANAHMKRCERSARSDTCSEECSSNDMCHYVLPEKLISNKCLPFFSNCLLWLQDQLIRSRCVRSSSPFPNQVKRICWQRLLENDYDDEQWRASGEIVDVHIELRSPY